MFPSADHQTKFTEQDRRTLVMEVTENIMATESLRSPL